MARKIFLGITSFRMRVVAKNVGFITPFTSTGSLSTKSFFKLEKMKWLLYQYSHHGQLMRDDALLSVTILLIVTSKTCKVAVNDRFTRIVSRSQKRVFFNILCFRSRSFA